MGELLRAIDSCIGSLVVRTALKLAPPLFVRPGEPRQAEWTEFGPGYRPVAHSRQQDEDAGTVYRPPAQPGGRRSPRTATTHGPLTVRLPG